MDFVGTGRRLGPGDIGTAARAPGVETAVLLAFLEVDAAGRGFGAKSRPEMLFEVLSGLEAFNKAMNRWRDKTEASIDAARKLLAAVEAGTGVLDGVTFAVTIGLPGIVAGIERAMDAIERARAVHKAKEAALRRAGGRNPGTRRIMQEIIRRQNIIFSKHLKSADALRDRALAVIWDYDPDARTIVDEMFSADDIDRFFKSMRQDRDGEGGREAAPLARGGAQIG